MMRINECASGMLDFANQQKTTSINLSVKDFSGILWTIAVVNEVPRDAMTVERTEKVTDTESAEGGKPDQTYISRFEDLSQYKIAPAFKVFVEPRCVYGTVYTFGLANMKKMRKFSAAERAKVLSPIDFQAVQEKIYAAFRKSSINFESLEALNREDSLANVLANVRDDKSAHVSSMDAVTRYPIELISGVVEAGYFTNKLEDVESIICHQVIRAIATA